jgi:hypothetical protein
MPQWGILKNALVICQFSGAATSLSKKRKEVVDQPLVN